MTAGQQTHGSQGMWGTGGHTPPPPVSLGQRYVEQRSTYPPPPAAYRAQAPSIGPVVAFTLIFGGFGAISAANRATRAKALGLPGRPYWSAFCWTFGLSSLLSIVASLVVVFMVLGFVASHPGNLSSGSQTEVTTSAVPWLEQSIVSEGEFHDSLGNVVTPAQAACIPVNVGADAAGIYRCTITFTDGVRNTVNLTSDASGRWVVN
ncbi:hypothetical protein KOI35_21950 [Actinoplanes bogorensis]|uniref:DUF4190 domain-containing protein n=1 Tax=Paractinoplanes bogorensis TaxID=1610840 RepID=A0ABS5YRU0_9ACTN|nr:hypothetical protein [Actinoplanes bogorensis]MBU2666167.1 hypothetical protein [Actinoplanes bogorensis]